MTEPVTLKRLSQMIRQFGDILAQSNRLAVTLLNSGASATDIANMLREQQATMANYLTQIAALVDLMRQHAGEFDAHQRESDDA
jgi:hypothetical protein